MFLLLYCDCYDIASITIVTLIIKTITLFVIVINIPIALQFFANYTRTLWNFRLHSMCFLQRNS